MSWPTLTPERAQELLEKVQDAQTELLEAAGCVTVFPGGGGAAHKCRVAAAHTSEACAWLKNHI